MCQNSTLCNEKFVLEWCRWLHGPLFDKSLVLGPSSWCISKFESNCISRPPVPFGGHAAVQFLQRISNKLASSSTEVFCSLESRLLVQFKSYLTRDHQFPDNMLHSHCYFSRVTPPHWGGSNMVQKKKNRRLVIFIFCRITVGLSWWIHQCWEVTRLEYKYKYKQQIKYMEENSVKSNSN